MSRKCSVERAGEFSWLAGRFLIMADKTQPAPETDHGLHTYIPPEARMREFTPRALILGTLLGVSDDILALSRAEGRRGKPRPFRSQSFRWRCSGFGQNSADLTPRFLNTISFKPRRFGGDPSFGLGVDAMS